MRIDRTTLGSTVTLRKALSHLRAFFPLAIFSGVFSVWREEVDLIHFGIAKREHKAKELFSAYGPLQLVGLPVSVKRVNWSQYEV